MCTFICSSTTSFLGSIHAHHSGETAGATQSCTSKGIGRQGIGSFCKEFLRVNTMPCRHWRQGTVSKHRNSFHMPLLLHFWFRSPRPRCLFRRDGASGCTPGRVLDMFIYIYIYMYIFIYNTYIYIYTCVYISRACARLSVLPRTRPAEYLTLYDMILYYVIILSLLCHSISLRYSIFIMYRAASDRGSARWDLSKPATRCLLDDRLDYSIVY